MRLIFFGDSHAHALIRALTKYGDQGEIAAIDIRRIKGQTANPKHIPPGLAIDYPADAVFCCLGGTEHNLLGLIESPEPFDFLLNPGDAITPGRKPVPHGLVRSALLSRMRTALARMSEVRAQYQCPFTYMAPPPPFAEIDDKANLPRAFIPHLEKGIAPATLRQKLYELQISLMKAHCRTEGIAFMPAPRKARDSSGYLLRQCWDNDPTHGNARYGAAVIRQMKGMKGLQLA